MTHNPSEIKIIGKNLNSYIQNCCSCNRKIYTIDKRKRKCRSCLKELKGGRIYTSNFFDIKKKLLLKQNNCILCKSKIRIAVHHRDGNTKNNDTQNLIVICSACHSSLHRKFGNKLKKMTIEQIPLKIDVGLFGNRLIYQSNIDII